MLSRWYVMPCMGIVDQIGAVESVKAASDIVESSAFGPRSFPNRTALNFFAFPLKLGVQYAPVSGTIQEINEKLNDKPGLLNKSPEDEGGAMGQWFLIQV